MARPFDSVDSPLMRQQPFSQFGGTATRETKPQLPKDGANAQPGIAGLQGTMQHAPAALLMALLSHPAFGPLIIKMLLGMK
jgi:hypothetical protein